MKRSNEGLVRPTPAEGRGCRTRLLGLWHETTSVEQAAQRALLDIARLPTPLEHLVVLRYGVRTDTRLPTFPMPDGLGLLTDPSCPVPVRRSRANSAGGAAADPDVAGSGPGSWARVAHRRSGKKEKVLAPGAGGPHRPASCRSAP